MTVLQSDVVVVGAGPAGSATALFLARRGYDVTLLDRALFPRPKPCGEFLTPGAVMLLRDALGVLPSLLAGGATPLTREVIVPHGGRAFGGPTQALACPRLVTDDVLRQTARAAGVRVVEGFAARRILFDGDTVTGVSDGHTRYQAPVTVGADGTHSLLARTLGVVRPLRRLQRLALVGHFLGMTSADPADDAVTMHLPADRADACCGVGAPAGPDGARNVNIVVPVGEARALAGRHEDYFGERLRRSFPAVWAQMADAQRVGLLRSIGCFGHHTTRATHGGAVLVGDAATFINPFTGEGVFFALRGAQMAAQVVDAALGARNVGADALRPYDALRHRELLPRYRLCDLVQRIVHSPALLAWASARLRGSAALTELLLQAVGDQARPCDLYSWHGLRLALTSF